MTYVFMLMFLLPGGKVHLIDVSAKAPVTVQTAVVLTCEMANGLPKVCRIQ
jgi:hypothetical protein